MSLVGDVGLLKFDEPSTEGLLKQRNNRLAGLRGPYATLKTGENGRSLRYTSVNAEGGIAVRRPLKPPNTFKELTCNVTIAIDV
jgi:hypothetical protein